MNEELIILLDKQQRRMQEILYFLQYVVEEYGKVRTSDIHRTKGTLIHDYYLFCIAKASRSIDSMDLLLTKNFPEDALCLARSIYENYLGATFIKKNPNSINNLVAAKISTYSGLLEHPKSKSGKPIWNKVITPDGDIDDVGISILKMSMNNGIEADQEMHISLYSLLSEFCHSNFISVASYWSEDAERFSCCSKGNNNFQAIVIGLFVTWLILECVIMGELLSVEDSNDASELSATASELLVVGLESINTQEAICDLPTKLLNRLSVSGA